MLHGTSVMSRLYCRNRREDRFAEKRGFRLAHAAAGGAQPLTGLRLVSLDATLVPCNAYIFRCGALPHPPAEALPLRSARGRRPLDPAYSGGIAACRGNSGYGGAGRPAGWRRSRARLDPKRAVRTSYATRASLRALRAAHARGLLSAGGLGGPAKRRPAGP